MQGVGGFEVQGSHGEGHHGCVSIEGPEERHCPAKHGTLISCSSFCNRENQTSRAFASIVQTCHVLTALLLKFHGTDRLCDNTQQGQ